MRCRLTKDFLFDAAQSLPRVSPEHRCSRLHGHGFKAEITIEGEVNPEMGWIYDHAEISRVVNPVIKILDHSYLNEVPGLENPTMECIAAWLWEKLLPDLPALAEITIHETPTARCTYRGE